MTGRAQPGSVGCLAGKEEAMKIKSKVKAGASVPYEYE